MKQCNICRELGEHFSNEHQIDEDRVPPMSRRKLITSMRNDMDKIIDALADQPEGYFNAPAHMDTPNVVRVVAAINRLKVEAGSVYKPAAGCKTTDERYQRLAKGTNNE